MAEEYISGCSRRSRFLTQELQEEILIRLPVKSLVRFELVCKTWLFRFHSRRFIDLYDSSRHLRNSSLELHPIGSKNLKKMIPGLADPCLTTKNTKEEGCWKYMFRMLGPLNGIYCITTYPYDSKSDRYSTLSGKIALFNPATRDYKFTNPFPCEFHSLLSDITSKGCHVHIGFGVLKNDYRVVVLINYNYSSANNASFLVFVYSVQKGVWKKLVDYEPGKRNVGEKKATEAFNIQGGGSRIVRIFHSLEECPQRFFEGCYYWMATTEGGDHKTWFVLSFNFAEESFKLIGLPPRHREIDMVEQRCRKRGGVFVLHDHLAAVYFFTVLSNDGARRTVEVGVWMMMDYGVEESWTRIHTIKPNFCCQVLYRLHGIHYTPLKSGGIRIERILFRDYEQIISCDDVGYQVIKLTYPTKLINMWWNTIGISTYIETLERLNKNSKCFDLYL